MKISSITYLKNDAQELLDTLYGYGELVELCLTLLKEGKETIHSAEVEEYVSVSRLQRFANRNMCGGQLTPILASREYEIEEILFVLSSFLPPLRDGFYSPYKDEYTANKNG